MSEFKTIPGHVEAAVNALLVEYDVSLKNLSERTLEQLPENIASAVRHMLTPYDWQPRKDLKDRDARYLSAALAERYSSVSRWTLSRAVVRGELRQIKLGGARSSKVLFDKLEIDKWLKTKQCRNRKS